MLKDHNPSAMPKILGAKLRNARLNSVLSLKSLGIETKISYTQISRIERGKFKKVSKNVQILCRYFEIDWTSWNSPSNASELVTRLQRAVAGSPQWVKVVSAFVDAIEAAQGVE